LDHLKAREESRRGNHWYVTCSKGPPAAAKPHRGSGIPRDLQTTNRHRIIYS